MKVSSHISFSCELRFLLGRSWLRAARNGSRDMMVKCSLNRRRCLLPLAALVQIQGHVINKFADCLCSSNTVRPSPVAEIAWKRFDGTKGFSWILYDKIFGPNIKQKYCGDIVRCLPIFSSLTPPPRQPGGGQILWGAGKKRVSSILHHPWCVLKLINATGNI